MFPKEKTHTVKLITRDGLVADVEVDEQVIRTSDRIVRHMSLAMPDEWSSGDVRPCESRSYRFRGYGIYDGKTVAEFVEEKPNETPQP